MFGRQLTKKKPKKIKNMCYSTIAEGKKDHRYMRYKSARAHMSRKKVGDSLSKYIEFHFIFSFLSQNLKEIIFFL